MSTQVTEKEARDVAEAARETSALIGAALTNAADGRTKIESMAEAGARLEGSFTEIKSLVDQIGDGSSDQWFSGLMRTIAGWYPCSGCPDT